MSWGFLGPQEASKRPSGRKTMIFRRMAPAKKSHKLGPFSVQDASKIDVGGVVLVTCFHDAFLLQNKRLKSPLKTRKTAKTIGGVFKNKLFYSIGPRWAPRGTFFIPFSEISRVFAPLLQIPTQTLRTPSSTFLPTEVTASA